MINIEAFFQLSYGMYIVSSGEGMSGNGFISNAVFQVSASPAKFAVCCNKDNFSSELIASNKAFSISVLSQDTPMPFIGTFGYKSGRDTNKFSNTTVSISETGTPIVTEHVLSFIECKLQQTVDAGSHLVFIGEAINAGAINEGTPLTYDYYRNVKKGVAPKNAPTFIDKSAHTETAPKIFDKHKCIICGYIYSEEDGDSTSGTAPGTKFDDLSDEWACPVCGASKGDFIKA